MSLIAELPEQNKLAESIATSDSDRIEEEEDVFFHDVELLKEHGISITDIEEMRKHGLNTIKGVQMTVRRTLAELTNFNLQKIDKILLACSKISANDEFMTAHELCEQLKAAFRLTTGSSNLDNLLGGGIESMSITEVFGEARTGKTQIAHTLCVTAQMPIGVNYTGGKVIFIDTEHSFRPQRIRAIAKRYELGATEVLENIHYARAYNSEHQLGLLKRVRSKLHEEPGIFKLLIVDSIMALFRVDFLGSAHIITRQEKLAEMMSLLKKISEEYNIAVFITNQITSEFNNKLGLLLDDVPKPVGGNILAHSSTTRVALKKLPGNLRIAFMFDSPELEEKEESFSITKGGISDPKLEEDH